MFWAASALGCAACMAKTSISPPLRVTDSSEQLDPPVSFMKSFQEICPKMPRASRKQADSLSNYQLPIIKWHPIDLKHN